MIYPIKLCVFLVGIVLMGQVVFSQSSELTFQERGNRQEGLVGKDVSRATLTLISATAYKESYRKNQNQNLHLEFYLPEQGGLHILGRQTCGKDMYRMKPKVSAKGRGWYDFYPWPVDEVLGQIQLPASCLGMLVRQEESKENFVSPSIIYHSKRPLMIRDYQFEFQCFENIRDLEYDIFKGNFYQKKLTAKARIFRSGLGDEILDGGEIVSLDFSTEDLELPSDWEGWLTLRVRARKAATEEKIRKIFFFYHKPYPNL